MKTISSFKIIVKNHKKTFQTFCILYRFNVNQNCA